MDTLTKLEQPSRPKSRKIILAIPTVSARPENMLLMTLTSIFEQLDAADRKECRVFVLDADAQSTESAYIKAVKARFSAEIAAKQLVIERTMPNDYPPLPMHQRDGYSRWMAKQNIDFSILLERCIPLGEYIVQLDDDVQAAPRFLKRIRNDIRYLSLFDWIALRVCSLGTIGVIFKSADLPPLISLLRNQFDQEPVDWLQSAYIKQQCQQGRFFFQIPRSLFLHLGLVSTSAAETKKYDIGPADFDAFYIHDLGVGRMGWLFQPLTNLYYRAKKVIHNAT